MNKTKGRNIIRRQWPNPKRSYPPSEPLTIPRKGHILAHHAVTIVGVAIHFEVICRHIETWITFEGSDCNIGRPNDNSQEERRHGGDQGHRSDHSHWFLSIRAQKKISLALRRVDFRSKRIQLPKMVLGRWVHCDACMCLFSTLNPSRLSFNFRR